METGGKEALALKVPFDEVYTLELNMESLKREFKLDFVMMNVNDAAENSSKLFKNAAGNTLPGKPQIIFE